MADMLGKNSISSKQYNRGLLLRLIATDVCKTRIELSKMTGLAKMTVTNIISEFLERDIVVECEEEMTEVCGRNPIRLKISEKAPKIIGLLVFRDRIEAVLCSLTMEILQMESICFEELTEEELIQDCYEVIDRILAKEKNVLGIGVAVLGPVDIRRGILLNPPRFYGVRNVEILKALKEKYAVPICLDHDNNSAALAEKLFGAGKSVEDFIFLGISNGIGSGIVSNGKIYHSHRGLTAEIGHVSIDRNGILCSCGNKGCLEMYASSYVVRNNLVRISGKNSSLAEFFEMDGCEEIDRIFQKMVENISAALISSINILQPELIILGHDCIDWGIKYVQLLENMINEKKVVHDGGKICVKKAFFGKNAQLVGAAANIADQAFQGNILFSQGWC